MAPSRRSNEDPNSRHGFVLWPWARFRLQDQIAKTAVLESPAQALRDARAGTRNERDANKVLAGAALSLIGVDATASAVLICGLGTDMSTNGVRLARRWVLRASDEERRAARLRMLQQAATGSDAVAAAFVSCGIIDRGVAAGLHNHVLWALRQVPEEQRFDLTLAIAEAAQFELRPVSDAELEKTWRKLRFAPGAGEVARRVARGQWRRWMRKDGFAQAWVQVATDSRVATSMGDAAWLLSGERDTQRRFATALQNHSGVVQNLSVHDPQIVGELAAVLGGDGDVAAKLSRAFPGTLSELAKVSRELSLERV